MRWIRILAIVLALLVVALAVAVVTLNSMDWSAYQQPIVEAVEKATGRKLSIDGELRLRIGLSPAVTVDGVTFANADQGTRPEMVKLDRFAVRLRLLPLLFGQVEIGRLELLGLDLWLETDAKGPPTVALAAVSGSDSAVRGAQASANLYSLVETAKANGIEPWAYLELVFTRLPAATPLEDVEALLPHRLQVRNDALC